MKQINHWHIQMSLTEHQKANFYIQQIWMVNYTESVKFLNTIGVYKLSFIQLYEIIEFGW